MKTINLQSTQEVVGKLSAHQKVLWNELQTQVVWSVSRHIEYRLPEIVWKQVGEIGIQIRRNTK